MTVQVFTFNVFQTNCFVCHDQGEAVVIDPGCADPKEQQAVVAYIQKHNLTVSHLLLTHAHIDHIFGCAFLSEQYGQSFQMHRSDLPLLKHGPEQARLFGVSFQAAPENVLFLEEGDCVTFGGIEWKVLLTPGHSPGSICFFDEVNRLVFSGDVLFQHSIGRTDLWKGSLSQLMGSIFQKVLPLGDDVKVYPGHGPTTTVGIERLQNPFLTGEYT